MAHKFAFETPALTTEAISAVARPELARHYKVLGTPHTVLNEETHLKGHLTEARLLIALRQLNSRRQF